MSRHIAVVGGGIAGLAAALRLVERGRDVRVTMLERSDRLGGVIVTERVDGYVIEGGPDVILAAKPAGVALCARLGLGDRLVGTAVRGSYVRTRGRLVPVPEGLSGLVPSRLAPFVRSPLLSTRGKLRVAMDLVVRPRRDDADESIESFIVRRLGREMYARLAEPLLSGIHAGDGARLALGATFPHLRQLERDHGGLLRGVLAARRTATEAGARSRGAFLSFPTGLAELIETAERELERPRDDGGAGARVTVLRRAAVAAVQTAGPRLVELRLADGGRVCCDGAVLATPAHAAATLLAGLAPEAARALGEIEHVSTAVVSVGLPLAAIARPLDGTGYTVPRAERRAVLACTWSSAKFAGRAPAGHALIRVFVGGAGREASLGGDDGALVRLALEELRQTMGVAAAPTLVRVHRWPHAMPQYHLGHRERIARAGDALAGLPVVLAGNAYAGVGIPDCIRSGQRAADTLLADLSLEEPAPAPQTSAR